jgi:Flp pilus assembly protein TadD
MNKSAKASLGVCALFALSLAAACGGASTPPPDNAANPPPLDEPGAQGGGGGEVAKPSNDQVKQGIDAIQAQDFEKAKGVLAEARKADPKDPQAAYYLGVALEALGDAKGAAAEYKAALELDPKLAEASVNLSGILLDGKDAAGALAAADAGLKSAPQNPDLLVNRALALEALGKKDEARQAYGAAVKARPADAALRMTYAEYLAEAGHGDAAVAELKAVTDTTDVPTLAALSLRFGRLKAFSECVAVLDKAIKIKPNPDLYTRRGVCRHDAGDDPGAQADYEEAIKLNGNFAPAHYYLGQHLCTTKDKKKALEAFDLAIKNAEGNFMRKAREGKEECAKAKPAAGKPAAGKSAPAAARK